QPVAVLLDDLADVVALERNRPFGEGPGHHVGVRERLGVTVYLESFLVPGDHHHSVMRLAPHRPVSTEILVVAVRVLVEGAGAEKVGPGDMWARALPAC